MARTTRIALTVANIDSIRDTVTEQLKSIYPNIQVDKNFTSPTDQRRILHWVSDANGERIAFSMFLTPGKKLAKGMTKLFIFSSGFNGDDAVQKAHFIKEFRNIHPNAEYSNGGGYGGAPASFLFFVEDMI